jgi:hypothetical protein
MTRLADSGWDVEISRALRVDRSAVRIISPFITRRAAERLLEHGDPDTFEVITRYDLAAFARRVSDTSALRTLIAAGARVRGVRAVHAKVYLFGTGGAIVTSANLTESGLRSNHEFGLVSSEAAITASALRYFTRLWERAGEDLTPGVIDGWDERIGVARSRGGRPSEIDRLPDLGTEAREVETNAGASVDPEVSIADDPSAPLPGVELPPAVREAGQAFVKIFGEASNRLEQTAPVFGEVDRSGSHWACTYPNGKRPRQAREGDVMYMGRLVRGPNDIMIFGRAIALRRHLEGLDDATEADLARRPWKTDWPHYVRVHGAEFVDGTMREGISLNALMDALAANAFAKTQENAAAETGNVNPRRTYSQQPAVRLSLQGAEWIGTRLEHAFRRHGMIQKATLETLDWPDVV